MALVQIFRDVSPVMKQNLSMSNSVAPRLGVQLAEHALPTGRVEWYMPTDKILVAKVIEENKVSYVGRSRISGLPDTEIPSRQHVRDLLETMSVTLKPGRPGESQLVLSGKLCGGVNLKSGTHPQFFRADGAYENGKKDVTADGKRACFVSALNLLESPECERECRRVGSVNRSNLLKKVLEKLLVLAPEEDATVRLRDKVTYAKKLWDLDSSAVSLGELVDDAVAYANALGEQPAPNSDEEIAARREERKEWYKFAATYGNRMAVAGLNTVLREERVGAVSAYVAGQRKLLSATVFQTWGSSHIVGAGVGLDGERKLRAVTFEGQLDFAAISSESVRSFSIERESDAVKLLDVGSELAADFGKASIGLFAGYESHFKKRSNQVHFVTCISYLGASQIVFDNPSPIAALKHYTSTGFVGEDGVVYPPKGVNADYDVLLNRYGTHYVAGYRPGALFLGSVSVALLENEDSSEVKTKLEAKAFDLFRVGGHFDAKSWFGSTSRQVDVHVETRGLSGPIAESFNIRGPEQLAAAVDSFRTACQKPENLGPIIAICEPWLTLGMDHVQIEAAQDRQSNSV